MFTVSPIFTTYVNRVISNANNKEAVSIDVFEMAHKTISEATASLVLGPVSKLLLSMFNIDEFYRHL